MKYSVSLKSNRDFRRLYSRGKQAVAPTMVLYTRKNRLQENRLGITTGKKLGNAVTGSGGACGKSIVSTRRSSCLAATWW